MPTWYWNVTQRDLWPEQWDNDQRLYDPGQEVEVEQEADLEAWADAHVHATLPITIQYGREVLAGRWCPECRGIVTQKSCEHFVPTWTPPMDVWAGLRAARDTLTVLFALSLVGAYVSGSWAPVIATGLLAGIAWGAYGGRESHGSQE